MYCALYVLHQNGQLKHTHNIHFNNRGVLYLLSKVYPPLVVMYNQNVYRPVRRGYKTDFHLIYHAYTCTTLRLCNHAPALWSLLNAFAWVHDVVNTCVTLLHECCLKTLLGRLSFLRGVHANNVLKWKWMHFVDTRVRVLKANILS